MKIISKDKKQKIKSVHHSIKTQMITSFVGLLICLVVTLMFINGKFLEPYYISKKESRFIELYEKLNDVSNEDKWDSTKKNNSLIHFAEKNNISYLVIEKDNDVHTNVHDKNMLKNQMMGYFLNQAQKESRTLDSTDVYQINQSWDPWNQSYYVDMWGSLDDGSQFLLRSPVESMRESASISNRFLLYIGSVLIVVSILLIWYFSKRITDPIRELRDYPTGWQILILMRNTPAAEAMRSENWERTLTGCQRNWRARSLNLRKLTTVCRKTSNRKTSWKR